MNMKMLEVCVDSLTSARNAIAGGADRLELCSALIAGGLTPYVELLEQIRADSEIPVRCLMRPRAGDFLYEPDQIDMMARQMPVLKAAGADGFVIGCLTKEGDLDEGAMKKLIDAADGAGLTLHRCIDVSRDPFETYRTAGRLGIDTVLTSGAASNCVLGLPTIGRLLELRDEIDGPEVLIGAGVKAEVIRNIRAWYPFARAFHASCKTDVESAMLFRRDGVPMGLPGLDEWHIPTTSREAVAAARAVLYEI